MASKTDFDPVPSSLVVGKEISRGSYGVVYSAELDRKPVAVKRVHEVLIASRGGEHTLEKFKAECDQMKALKHPHVVGFIGAYKDKKGPVLVMELMDESLEKYLERNRERLSSERIWEICSSVCEGLAYLHGRYKPIIHRDVGSRNVLLTKGGVVKIADFGQAKLLNNKAEIIKTTQPGAIVYMPPEALTKKKKYSAKVDSFSLGVLLLEICTQHPPTSGWDGINAVIEVIRRKDDLNMLDDAHPLKPIIIWCLQHEKLRPAVGVIRDHVARSNSVHNNAQRIATLEGELQIVKHEIECERVHVTELEAALKFANEEKESKSQQIHSLQRERDQLQKELDEYKSCKVKESADDSRKKPAPDLFSSTMSSRGKCLYYITLQDIPLVRDEGQSSWGKFKEKAKEFANLTGPTHLLKGELIIVHDEGFGDYVRGRSTTDGSKRIVCKKMCLSFLTDNEYQLLAPLKPPCDRLALFNNKQSLYAIKKLKPGDKTWVSVPVQPHYAPGLPGTTCRRATIRYIGEIQGEVGFYFGVELQIPEGRNDGSFRNERYFICEDKHGIFLPASHLNASLKTQGKSLPTPAKGKVLLEVNKSASGQEFCENDQVVVFDEEGERITGKVKWTYPDVGRKYHIIGIETDDHLKRKIEGHVVGYSHLFNNRDYKNHTYLAMPETAVLKDDGTPVDGQDPLLQGYNANN